MIGAVKSLIGTAGKIVSVTSQFEQTQKSLETVLQSAEKGKALFEDLRKFSFDTTFGVDELASASSQLLNAGASVKTLQKDLKMLGDLAQGDKMKFQELTSIFAKIQNTGRATSMQLQQLALRGIPIQKTLQEMGVTGVASAEQLTAAFKKLTDEGGQFHNAMGNIIDTIEGKQGFIADTIKEIYVNLGQATGFTDMFKKGLDMLYESLNWLNNTLMKINENPILKALFQGVIVGAITALVVAIGQALVPVIMTKLLPALKSINATLMQNPVFLIVGGLAALGTAVAGFVINAKNAKDELTGVKKTVEEIKSLESDLGLDDISTRKAKKNVKKGTATTEESTKVAIENYKKEKIALQELEQDLKEVQELRKEDATNWYHNERMKNLEEEIEKQKKIVAVREDMMKVEQAQLEMERKREQQYELMMEQIEKEKKAFMDLSKQADEFYANTSQGKLETELEKLQELQKMYNNKGATKRFRDGSVMNMKLDDKQLLGIENELKKIEKSVADIQRATLKEQIEGQLTNYQKVVMNMLGLSIDDLIDKGFASIDKQTGKVTGINLGTANLVDSVTKDVFGELEKKYSIFNAGQYAGSSRQSKTNALEEQLKKQQDLLNTLVARADINKQDLYIKGEYVSGKGELDINKKEYLRLLDEIAKTERDLMLSKLDDLRQEKYLLQSRIKSEGTLEAALLKGQALQEGIAKEEYENWKKLKREIEDLQNPVQSLSDWGARKRERGREDNDIAEQIGGLLAQSLGNLLSGSDYGKMIDGMISGESGWTVVISMLVDGLTSVIGGIEGVDMVLSPLKDALQQIAPLIKTVLVGLYPITYALNWLFESIMKFLNWITNGWFDEMASLWDEYVEAQSNATKSTEELTKQQQSLLQAMIAQEEYYIGMKKQINSDSYRDRVYSVNDMILTPNGRFSTSPQDTIIAMKHPEQMMNSGVSIKIVNNAGVDVNARQGENKNEFLITISKKVANDYAYGLNGWDNATRVRQVTEQGSVR